MPGPIDDVLKHLTELSPQDWVVRGGLVPLAQMKQRFDREGPSQELRRGLAQAGP